MGAVLKIRKEFNCNEKSQTAKEALGKYNLAGSSKDDKLCVKH